MRALFTLTTLLGSALLFAVQPMAARALLPHTGGTTALWTACALFFQAALLAGYAWSHALPAALGRRPHAALHALALAAAAATLPASFVGVSLAGADPWREVLGALAARVGLAYVCLATSAPLLQRWWTERTGRDPAPLVAVSNLGSLGALALHPLALDRFVPLAAQWRGFNALWALWALCTVACALVAWQTPASEAPAPAEAPVGARRWWRYVALAFVPASMMLGVTAHLTADWGATPLLWALPLGLYLASFVVVFARTPPEPGPRVTAPYLGLLAMMFLFTAPQVATRLPLVAGHLALFAATAWIFHGALARERPRDASITSFQLALAVGGALAGAFASWLAPRVFTGVTEYPLAMALAVALLPPPPPAPTADRRARQEALLRDVGLDPASVLGPAPPPPAPRGFGALDLVVPLAVGGLAAALFTARLDARAPSLVRWGLPLLALVLGSIGRRARLALGLVAILAASRLDGGLVHASRTFYGVLRVDEHRGVRRFLHGTTLHGLQHLAEKTRLRPVAYYAPEAPIGQAMRALAPRLAGADVAVLGLGVGMLLAHASPGQRWTFFELDPAVERVARAHFTWIRDARAPVTVVTGDARAQLARREGARYGLLVLDAFSSDAIPTHLLTREAMAVWRTRTAPDGVVAFHVTNRHARLDDVVAALARDAGMVCLRGRGAGFGPEGPVWTTWVLTARRWEHLGALADDPRWTRLEAPARAPVWRDELADVLPALLGR